MTLRLPHRLQPGRGLAHARKSVHRSKVAISGLGVCLLAGCANPTPDRGTYTPTGNPVVDGLALRDRAPTRDRVLWNYRVGLTALRRGQPAEARTLFDEALATEQGMIGPNTEARRSRRAFAAESRKTFIGEPYERALAYYYRGLLYWMDGEPDNARACFRSGQFIDSDADTQSYAGDYALFDYLDGFITTRLGGDGSDAFARAQSAARLAKPAPYYPPWNVFLFVDLGEGPRKYATGDYQEQLRFRAGTARTTRARITVGGQTLVADVWDDVSFQATTRGGRVMDHVLANKAVFKRTTDIAGTAAILGGAAMASHQGRHSVADEVGAGMIVAGVVSKIFSAATTPAADTRSWDNLPNYLAFTATQLPPGDHPATVEFLDGEGRPLNEWTRQLTVHVPPAGRDAILFVSDRDR